MVLIPCHRKDYARQQSRRIAFNRDLITIDRSVRGRVKSDAPRASRFNNVMTFAGDGQRCEISGLMNQHFMHCLHQERVSRWIELIGFNGRLLDLHGTSTGGVRATQCLPAATTLQTPEKFASKIQRAEHDP